MNRKFKRFCDDFSTLTSVLSEKCQAYISGIIGVLTPHTVDRAADFLCHFSIIRFAANPAWGGSKRTAFARRGLIAIGPQRHTL
jgi:hypothetical protein